MRKLFKIKNFILFQHVYQQLRYKLFLEPMMVEFCVCE
jgi:hypothetical protein